jgi:L-alanine-DL-glutamate epimerase-like enolase superfamily enzyme
MLIGQERRWRRYGRDDRLIRRPVQIRAAEMTPLDDDAPQAKALGFGGSKIKVGRPVNEDVGRLKIVWAAVGPTFEISRR